jgi:hypothetical protein
MFLSVIYKLIRRIYLYWQAGFMKSINKNKTGMIEAFSESHSKGKYKLWDESHNTGKYKLWDEWKDYLNKRIDIVFDDREKASIKRGILLSVSDAFVIIHIEETGIPEAYPVSRIIRLILLGEPDSNTTIKSQGCASNKTNNRIVDSN